ncbi:MAG: hypothetical protein M3R66_14555 [Actinomycetota bacterium]|nr:hypothetical protein [Actinomycetota bacterium]
MADLERAERIRQWHEGAYASGKAEGRSEQTFSYLGRSLVVPPGVMPITGVSHLLGKAVLAEVRAGDSVLDMGTGNKDGWQVDYLTFRMTQLTLAP